MTRPARAWVCGIDPGAKGAIAAVAFEGAEPVSLLIYDMPTVPVVLASGKKRTAIDFIKLHCVGRHMSAERDASVWLEMPNAMPHDGPVQAFAFGKACGAVQMAFTWVGRAVNLVRPATWKAAMGVTADKKTAVERVHQLLPRFKEHFPARKDGRAEAALLAVYGYTQQRQNAVIKNQ